MDILALSFNKNNVGQLRKPYRWKLSLVNCFKYFLLYETEISHEQAHAVDFNTLQFSLVNMYICLMRKNSVWVYLQYGL